MADPTGFGDDGMRVEDSALSVGRLMSTESVSVVLTRGPVSGAYFEPGTGWVTVSEPAPDSFARAYAQCFPTTYTCTVCGSEHIAKPGELPAP